MLIRKVRLSDAAEIAEIYNRHIIHTTVTFETEPVDADEMKRRIAGFSADGLYFVCESEGKVAGYCYAHTWKTKDAYSRTLETTVYVAENFKHAGVGTMLMERLISECRRSGIHALVACITDGNAESVDFHRRLGFRRVSHFSQVGRKFGEWIDIEDYELILDSDSIKGKEDLHIAQP